MDEEGQSLNLVEKSLKRVDINLRDANGSFRNMQDVLAEIASRWKDIGKQDDINGTENQAFIAQQIAGKIYARTCGNTRVKYILIIDKFQIL